MSPTASEYQQFFTNLAQEPYPGHDTFRLQQGLLWQRGKLSRIFDGIEPGWLPSMTVRDAIVTYSVILRELAQRLDKQVYLATFEDVLIWLHLRNQRQPVEIYSSALKWLIYKKLHLPTYVQPVRQILGIHSPYSRSYSQLDTVPELSGEEKSSLQLIASPFTFFSLISYVTETEGYYQALKTVKTLTKDLQSLDAALHGKLRQSPEYFVRKLLGVLNEYHAYRSIFFTNFDVDPSLRDQSITKYRFSPLHDQAPRFLYNYVIKYMAHESRRYSEKFYGSNAEFPLVLRYPQQFSAIHFALVNPVLQSFYSDKRSNSPVSVQEFVDHLVGFGIRPGIASEIISTPHRYTPIWKPYLRQIRSPQSYAFGYYGFSQYPYKFLEYLFFSIRNEVHRMHKQGYTRMSNYDWIVIAINVVAQLSELGTGSSPDYLKHPLVQFMFAAPIQTPATGPVSESSQKGESYIICLTCETRNNSKNNYCIGCGTKF